METARIMTWGYHAPSNPFSMGTTMSISRFAGDLLNALVVNDVGQIHPIVFVCHSMGGLIAKQAVISGSANRQFCHIVNNVKGMVFFATPHRGANLAKMAASIDTVVRASQLTDNRRYIQELAPESDRIEDINRDFQYHLSRLFVLSFYEECPSSFVGEVVIVPRASAILDSIGETSCGIHADHISICKYPTSDCPQYRVAASNISRFIRMINVFTSPDSSPGALDVFALFIYSDELGVKQARADVLERARGVVGSIIGRDHKLLEHLAELKANVWWHEQLMRRVESLNLPADMRNFFSVQNFEDRVEIMGKRALLENQ